MEAEATAGAKMRITEVVRSGGVRKRLAEVVGGSGKRED